MSAAVTSFPAGKSRLFLCFDKMTKPSVIFGAVMKKIDAFFRIFSPVHIPPVLI